MHDLGDVIKIKAHTPTQTRNARTLLWLRACYSCEMLRYGESLRLPLSQQSPCESSLTFFSVIARPASPLLHQRGGGRAAGRARRNVVPHPLQPPSPCPQNPQPSATAAALQFSSGQLRATWCQERYVGGEWVGYCRLTALVF